MIHTLEAAVLYITFEVVFVTDSCNITNMTGGKIESILFHPIEEKEICEVIEPAPRPVFIYDEGGKQQECYIRVGNSSKPYTLDEFYEYSRRRFK